MKIKWIPGYFILLAVVAILDAFIDLGISKTEIAALSLSIYVLISLGIHYKKWARRLVVAAIVLVILVFLSDMVLTWGVQRFRSGGVSPAPQTPWVSGENVTHGLVWLTQIKSWLDIRPFVSWLIEGRKPQVAYDRGLFVMLLVLLSLLMHKLYESKWLKPLLALPIAFFVVGWYSYMDFTWGIYASYFVGIGAYTIIEKHHQLMAARPDYQTSYYSKRLILLWSFGISVLLMGSSALVYWALPVERINDQITGIIPNLWGVRTGHAQSELGVFSLLETPFQQDTGALGGPIRNLDDETALFWVHMDAPVKAPVYLKSVTKDFYTGKRWVSQTAVYKNDFAFYKERPEHLALMREKPDTYVSGKVEMDALRAITLFTPMGFFASDIDPEKVYVSIENEAFYKSGAWVRPIRSYTFEATGQDFHYNPDLDYLQVGKSVDPKVLAIARSLGRFGRGNYQKMMILTQYLVQNYDYELLVSPEFVREDFVSNFILEMDSGYCTYFASALTIMARLNNIPARYVEGFVIAPSAFDADNKARVTEAQAHAWTEAYFPDRGWVIFEPTPPYYGEDLSAPLFYEVPEETPQTTDSEAQEGEDQVIDESLLGAVDVFEDGMMGPIDFDRPIRDPYVREEEGSGLGTDSELVLEAAQKSKTALLIRGILLLGLALGLLILPGHLYLNPKNQRKKAIRHMYFLGHLVYEARDLKHPNLEVRFLQISVPRENLGPWFRVLYDQKHEVPDQVLRFVLNDVKRHLQMETERYKIKKGRLAYYKLRYFDIKKVTS